jgi:hypothetical protein
MTKSKNYEPSLALILEIVNAEMFLVFLRECALFLKRLFAAVLIDLILEGF